ncbi:hypothetical protein ACRAWF_30520 [Streptomyces sp. L7]
MDGIAVTNLRTPAVSVAATAPLLTGSRGPVELVVFGAGPQAVGHVDAIRAADSVELADVTPAAGPPTPNGPRAQLPPRATVVAADSPD